MSALQSEIFEAFRAMGVPEDKALKAAEVLSRNKDEEILKAQESRLAEALKLHEHRFDKIEDCLIKIESDVVGLKADVASLRADVAGLKTDVTGLKGDVVRLKTDAAVTKWMMGFVLAFQVAIVVKLFFRACGSP